MGAKSPRAATDRLRPKSLLICPTCGHESSPNGDWRTRKQETASDPTMALVCPECRTDITHRPLSETESREDALAPSCQ